MKPNLSDQHFFDLYVKNKSWLPLQNHGLKDKDIILNKEDFDFPNQIKTYLNLFKNIDANNKSILDIGCGYGRGSHIIQKYFQDSIVTGTDINYSFIEYAKEKYKQCNYIQDDLYNTKIADSSFDFIILNCSMHFFYNQDIALQNIKNILKPKGYILITDLWTKEMFVIFLQKCKDNNLKIVSIEDQTNNTITAIEEDISTTFIKFKPQINNETISAFIDIQKERLQFYKQNINRHYKFVIQ